MSDYDVEYYQIFAGLTTEDAIAKRCEELSFAQIDPAENLRIYRKLIHQKQDVRQKLTGKDLAKLEEETAGLN